MFTPIKLASKTGFPATWKVGRSQGLSGNYKIVRESQGSLLKIGVCQGS